MRDRRQSHAAGLALALVLTAPLSASADEVFPLRSLEARPVSALFSGWRGEVVDWLRFLCAEAGCLDEATGFADATGFGIRITGSTLDIDSLVAAFWVAAQVPFPAPDLSGVDGDLLNLRTASIELRFSAAGSPRFFGLPAEMTLEIDGLEMSGEAAAVLVGYLGVADPLRSFVSQMIASERAAFDLGIALGEGGARVGLEVALSSGDALAAELRLDAADILGSGRLGNPGEAALVTDSASLDLFLRTTNRALFEFLLLPAAVDLTLRESTVLDRVYGPFVFSVGTDAERQLWESLAAERQTAGDLSANEQALAEGAIRFASGWRAGDNPLRVAWRVGGLFSRQSGERCYLSSAAGVTWDLFRVLSRPYGEAIPFVEGGLDGFIRLPGLSFGYAGCADFVVE